MPCIFVPMAQLTHKQELFCNKYIECGNASEAYRSVYSCANWTESSVWENASRMLSNVKVLARVNELKEELAQRSAITKDRILQEYAKVGFSSIAHLHNTWVKRKEFESLTEEQKSSIKSISTRTRVVDEGTAIVEEVKIELYDKLRALDSIVKMLGFDAPAEVNIKKSIHEMTDEELIQIRDSYVR